VECFSRPVSFGGDLASFKTAYSSIPGKGIASARLGAPRFGCSVGGVAAPAAPERGNRPVKTYLLLFAAIVAEVIATTALARSESFSRLVPSLIAVVGYAAAFWFLSTPLRTMPTGIVYAIWSGLGIVLIALVAWLWAKQPLDSAAIAGLGLILAGVVVVNVFSDTVKH
jgi:small multidrug resistance pump